jgi:hypothetical protein
VDNIYTVRKMSSNFYMRNRMMQRTGIGRGEEEEGRGGMFGSMSSS